MSKIELTVADQLRAAGMTPEIRTLPDAMRGVYVSRPPDRFGAIKQSANGNLTAIVHTPKFCEVWWIFHGQIGESVERMRRLIDAPDRLGKIDAANSGAPAVPISPHQSDDGNESPTAGGRI